MEALLTQSTKRTFSRHPRRKRVLIGPVEIAGYYSTLAEGLRGLGLEADFVSFSPHPFAYASHLSESRMLEFIHKLHEQIRFGSSRFIKLLSAIPWLLATHSWSCVAIFRYDTFIFGFGQSLFPVTNLDLPILRLLGKQVIMNVGHGSEARPPYLNGVNISSSGPLRAVNYYRNAKRIKRRMGFLEKHSTQIIGSPFSTHFFASRPFINWFEIGIPRPLIPLVQPTPVEGGLVSPVERSTDPKTRKVRIVHAPSAPIAKGTSEIRRVLAELEGEGWQIELIELQGATNRVVLENLSKCDFVVDQLYSDSPLPGLASEAASFGKPTILGSYAIDAFKAHISVEMLPPSYVVHPTQLKTAIRHFLENPAEARTLGARAQAFVENQWEASAVAARFMAIFKNSIPIDWFVNPLDVSYVYGACQDESSTRMILGEILDVLGETALCLNDRPDLLRNLRGVGLLPVVQQP